VLLFAHICAQFLALAGGLFQFFFVITLLSVVFSVIRNFIGSGSNNKKGKDDGWGDL
jgi:hypothetical protein